MHNNLSYDPWSNKLNILCSLHKHIIVILNTPSAPIIHLKHPSFPPILLRYRNNQWYSLKELQLYYLIFPLYHFNHIPFLSHPPLKFYFTKLVPYVIIGYDTLFPPISSMYLSEIIIPLLIPWDPKKSLKAEALKVHKYYLFSSICVLVYPNHCLIVLIFCAFPVPIVQNPSSS